MRVHQVSEMETLLVVERRKTSGASIVRRTGRLAPFRYRCVTWFLIVFLMMMSSVMACQVPVFRYALERWLADQYEIVVLHDGPIQRDALDRFEKLQALASQNSNAVVRDIDIQETKNQGYVAGRLLSAERS
jgi:hypothetical protein